MMWKLQLSNNSLEWKNVTFFFGGGGVKTYSDPPAYFRDQDPQLPWSTSLASIILRYLSSVTPDVRNNPRSCEIRFKLDRAYGNFRVLRPCFDHSSMCVNDVLFACRQQQGAGSAPVVAGQKRQAQSIFRHSVRWRFSTCTTATAAETGLSVWHK